MPAPRASFVDLTVAGEHLGLYTMVEQVDKDFLAKHFEDDDGDSSIWRNATIIETKTRQYKATELNELIQEGLVRWVLRDNKLDKARSGVTTPTPTKRCFQIRLSVSRVSYSSTYFGKRWVKSSRKSSNEP